MRKWQVGDPVGDGNDIGVPDTKYMGYLNKHGEDESASTLGSLPPISEKSRQSLEYERNIKEARKENSFILSNDVKIIGYYTNALKAYDKFWAAEGHVPQYGELPKDRIFDNRDINIIKEVYRRSLNVKGSTLRQSSAKILNRTGNKNYVDFTKKDVEERREQWRIKRHRDCVTASRGYYFETIEKANKFALNNSPKKAIKHYKEAIVYHERYFSGDYEKYDGNNYKKLPQPPERFTHSALVNLFDIYLHTHPDNPKSRKNNLNVEVKKLIGDLHSKELEELDLKAHELYLQDKREKEIRREKIEDAIVDGIVIAKKFGDKAYNFLEKKIQ